MNIIKAILFGILAVLGLVLTWITGLLAHPVVFVVNLFGGITLLVLTDLTTLGWTLVALGAYGIFVLFLLAVLTIYAASRTPRSSYGSISRRPASRGRLFRDP